MDSVHTYASDIALTASVKAIQTRIGFAAPISTWRNEAPGRHGSRPIWHALSRRRRAFSRHREREGTALYPASRRPAWLSQGARRQDPRPCRFCRQSALHHAGHSHGQPQGASFLDRLYAAAAHQDLGRGANRRGQNRADGEAYTRRLQGTPRTANPIHRFCLGCQLSDSVPVVTSGGICGPQGRSADSTVRGSGRRGAALRTDVCEG
jgi:hypothetical protein